MGKPRPNLAFSFCDLLLNWSLIQFYFPKSMVLHLPIRPNINSKIHFIYILKQCKVVKPGLLQYTELCIRLHFVNVFLIFMTAFTPLYLNIKLYSWLFSLGSTAGFLLLWPERSNLFEMLIYYIFCKQKEIGQERTTRQKQK